MGLENDPRLELLPPPLSLTSVFRDGHTHFFAPLWRKRDVSEPINPSCTCARVSDSQPDTGSRPLRTAAAHLCLLTTCCPFFLRYQKDALYGFTRINSARSVSNTWNLCMFCALTVLRNKNIRVEVWEHLWWVICPMWPWQVFFDFLWVERGEKRWLWCWFKQPWQFVRDTVGVHYVISWIVFISQKAWAGLLLSAASQRERQ